MFRIKWIFIFMLLLILSMGCLRNEEQKIVVQKWIHQNYEDYKEIIDLKKVFIAREILHHADWMRGTVDMVREPDYQFAFQFTDPKIEAKAVLYSIWISPKKDTVEVTEGNQQYVHLNHKDSEKLFEILTGMGLKEIK